MQFSLIELTILIHILCSTTFDFIAKNPSYDIYVILVHFGEEYRGKVESKIKNIEDTQKQRITSQFKQTYNKLEKVDKFIL